MDPRGHRPPSRGRSGHGARLAARAPPHRGRVPRRGLPRRDHHAGRLVRPHSMKIDAVELRRVHVRLVAPFKTSFGTQEHRDILLVHVIASDAEGWGECVALTEPLYSAEYVDGAQEVIRTHLLPRLLAVDDVRATDVATMLRPIRGHPMAKAAVEMAILDAELRAQDVSFGAFLGAVRSEVDCGVSVGIHETEAELLDAVERHVEEGYRRIKLKVEPGHDVDPVRAVRRHFGDIALQV